MSLVNTISSTGRDKIYFESNKFNASSHGFILKSLEHLSRPLPSYMRKVHSKPVFLIHFIFFRYREFFSWNKSETHCALHNRSRYDKPFYMVFRYSSLYNQLKSPIYSVLYASNVNPCFKIPQITFVCLLSAFYLKYNLWIYVQTELFLLWPINHFHKLPGEKVVLRRSKSNNFWQASVNRQKTEKK